MANSLYSINGIQDCNIYVYDDCSTEFDISFLESVFPTATIIRHDKNIRADANLKFMYKDL